MKYLKHFINRLSGYIYFKTMSEYTLRKTTDKFVNKYWLEKLYGWFF